MPPADSKRNPTARPRPDLLDDLANAMVAARKSLGDQNGVITMRRLNRREYKNTLRELLGVDISVSELPATPATAALIRSVRIYLCRPINSNNIMRSGVRRSTSCLIARPPPRSKKKLRYEVEESTPKIRKIVA